MERVGYGFAACIGNGERIAPCVVDIPCDKFTGCTEYLIYVAGKGATNNVVRRNACRVFILDAAQHAERIVSIPQHNAVRAFFAQQLTVHILILRCHTARRFFKTQTVNVVFICVLLAVLRQRRQLPSRPRHRHAVAVGQRIADLIIRDALTVVGRHQVFPTRLRIPVLNRSRRRYRRGLWRRRGSRFRRWGRRRCRLWRGRRGRLRCWGGVQRDLYVLRRYITRLAAVRHLVPTGVRYIQYRYRRAERNRDQNTVACSRPRTHIQSGRRRDFARADNRRRRRWFRCRRCRCDLHILPKNISGFTAVCYFVPAGRRIQHRYRSAKRNRNQYAIACTGAGTHV